MDIGALLLEIKELSSLFEAKTKAPKRKKLKTKKPQDATSKTLKRRATLKTVKGGSSFSNKTTFKDTPGDALVHSDADCKKGLRGTSPTSDFASDKSPRHCGKKSFPIKKGTANRARIAGSLRMGYQLRKEGKISDAALNKIMTAARSLGMTPKGDLTRDRIKSGPCAQYSAALQSHGKVRASKVLPKGWRPKDCRVGGHGEGGPDEWLRKFSGSRRKKSPLHPKHTKEYFPHRLSSRDSSSYEIHKGNKLPKRHARDYNYAKRGGHWGHSERSKKGVLTRTKLKTVKAKS